ncbi:DUF5667 domain-containing protein [Amycolatopsis sp. NPDC049252]|uniref:DUF5667 domain-containing protein n=1 Tax=Amycolatopsis sp. NPDC049252 TaxID=3363933 RepID=UPI00370FDFE2
MRFARERADADRFARALEPSPVRRDGEFADELVVVGALRELGAAGAPDLETRQRIRAEIAGRLETAAATPVRRWRPRTADLVAAALFLVLLLSGLTLVLSRNALPGDALYAVKRAGETTTLNLTFGDQEKAKKHLEFATNRVTELGELAAEGASDADYRTAYDDFASDLRAGVTQLTAVATSDGSGAQQLSDVRLWARNQAARLAAQQGALPAEAASVFGEAQTLLGKVQERTSGLVARLNCYQITTGKADDLGLLPATGECTQRPAPSSGGDPSSVPTAPSSDTATTTPAPTGTQLPPSDATATAGTPAPTGGLTPPPVFGQPPTTSRPPATSTSKAPPLVSLPPLLPGLPPIIIG